MEKVKKTSCLLQGLILFAFSYCVVFTCGTEIGNPQSSVSSTGTTDAMIAKKYVVVGQAGLLLYTSKLTDSWMSNIQVGALNDIIQNGLQYLAVGDAGKIISATSIDQVSWATLTSGTTPWSATEIFQKYFVVINTTGKLLYSSSLESGWSEKNLGNALYSLAKSPKNLAIAGKDKIYFTSDLTGSIADRSPLGSFTIRGATFGAGKWVFVGDSGQVFVSVDDGISWSSQKIASVNLRAVTYGNGYYVVVGENSLYYSKNPESAFTANNQAANLFDVNFINETFIAVGDSGKIIFTADPTTSWQLNQQSGNLRAISAGF